MKAIAAPVPSELLVRELSELSPLRQFRGLEIYSFQGDQYPSLMYEIGRIRELVFRSVGAGRGEPVDLDALDEGPHSYHQLLVWDPQHEQVVALYRYQFGAKTLGPEGVKVRTEGLFEFSSEFREHWLPQGIELGRSVVNPDARKRTLGFFAVWQGLGALIEHNPSLCCFFGNVSLYQNLSAPALDTMISFCQQHYAPPQPLMQARPSLKYRVTEERVLPDLSDYSTTECIAQLRTLLNEHSVRIPPILQSYMGLGRGIYFEDAAADADFGDAYEMAIIVPIRAIDPAVLEKFAKLGP